MAANNERQIILEDGAVRLILEKSRIANPVNFGFGFLPGQPVGKITLQVTNQITDLNRQQLAFGVKRILREFGKNMHIYSDRLGVAGFYGDSQNAGLIKIFKRMGAKVMKSPTADGIISMSAYAWGVELHNYPLKYLNAPVKRIIIRPKMPEKGEVRFFENPGRYVLSTSGAKIIIGISQVPQHHQDGVFKPGEKFGTISIFGKNQASIRLLLREFGRRIPYFKSAGLVGIRGTTANPKLLELAGRVGGKITPASGELEGILKTIALIGAVQGKVRFSDIFKQKQTAALRFDSLRKTPIGKTAWKSPID